MYALLLANAMQNYCKCLGVANILTIFIQVCYLYVRDEWSTVSFFTNYRSFFVNEIREKHGIFAL